MQTCTLNAANVALFYNENYIQISSGNLYAEGSNLKASLEAEGHQVTTFSGIHASDFQAALNETDLLIIPELERKNLFADLDQAAKTLLKQYINNGGGLIICGVVAPNMANSANALNLLNGIYDFELEADAIAFAGYSKILANDAQNTAFDDCPLEIINNNSIAFLTGGYPTGTKKLYSDTVEDDNTTVALLPYGDGDIAYLGWGWWNAVPEGAQDHGWIQILNAAIEEVACTAPIAKAIGNYTLTLDQTGYAQLNPNVLDDNSYSCSSFFELTATPAHFTCEEVGTQQITFRITDNLGRTAITYTTIEVQDPNNVCITSAPVASLYGKIMAQTGKMIQGVTITAEGSEKAPINTMEDGIYTFDELPKGQAYNLVPQKLDRPLNGVSTYDLVLMSQHILGIREFTSPYHFIAADINQSGTITTADIIEARQLILYIKDAFSNNTSWRFVNADYIFNNPSNPLAEDFPETFPLESLQEDTNINFIAIKIGDLSDNANPNDYVNNSINRNCEKCTLQVEAVSLEREHTCSIDFLTKDALPLVAFQMTLAYDNQLIKNISLNSTLFGDNLGVNIDENQGLIHLNAYHPTPVQTTALSSLFTIEFEAIQQLSTSDIFMISDRHIEAALYDQYKTFALELNYAPSEAISVHNMLTYNFQTYQNQPNPFKDYTKVGFDLEVPSSVTCTIYNLSGQQLYTITKDYEAGHHQIQLNANDLAAKGMMIYTIETPYQSISKRMVKQ